MRTAVEPIGKMTPYGPEHIATLVFTALIAVVLVVLGRRIRGTAAEDRMLRALGWTMLIATVAWTIWGMLPGHWDINQSLPFHYSDALRMITAIALITRAGWAIVICYYWGLGFRPTWRGYGVAYLATAMWAGIALIANAMTGANYGYLSREPEDVSILDLLGPWPVYIFWEAVIIAVVWALMTWPWQLNPGRGHPTVDRLGTIRRKTARSDTFSLHIESLLTSSKHWANASEASSRYRS